MGVADLYEFRHARRSPSGADFEGPAQLGEGRGTGAQIGAEASATKLGENMSRAEKLAQFPGQEDSFLSSVKNFGLDVYDKSGLDSALEFIDRGRRTINLVAQDNLVASMFVTPLTTLPVFVSNLLREDGAMQADQRHGYEITGQDYIDMLLGRTDKVADRMGIETADALLGVSRDVSTSAVWDANEFFTSEWVDTLPRGIGNLAAGVRFAGTFGVDMLNDPTTYVTGGMGGLGRNAAKGVVNTAVRKSAMTVTDDIIRAGSTRVARAAIKETPYTGINRVAAGRILDRVDDVMRKNPKALFDDVVRQESGLSKQVQVKAADPKKPLKVLDFDPDDPEQFIITKWSDEVAERTSVYEDIQTKLGQNMETKYFDDTDEVWRGWVEEAAGDPKKVWTTGGLRFGQGQVSSQVPWVTDRTRGLQRRATRKITESKAAKKVFARPGWKNQKARWDSLRAKMSREAPEAIRAAQGQGAFTYSSYVNTYQVAPVLAIKRLGVDATIDTVNSSAIWRTLSGQIDEQFGDLAPDVLKRVRDSIGSGTAVDLKDFAGSPKIAKTVKQVQDYFDKSYDDLASKFAQIDPEFERLLKANRQYRPMVFNENFGIAMSEVAALHTEEIGRIVTNADRAAKAAEIGVTPKALDEFLSVLNQYGEGAARARPFGETAELNWRKVGKVGMILEDGKTDVGFRPLNQINEELSDTAKKVFEHIGYESKATKRLTDAGGDILVLDPQQQLEQYATNIQTVIQERVIVGEAIRNNLASIKTDGVNINALLSVLAEQNEDGVSLIGRLKEFGVDVGESATKQELVAATLFVDMTPINLGNGKTINVSRELMADPDFQKIVANLQDQYKRANETVKQFPYEYQRQMKKVMAAAKRTGEPLTEGQAHTLAARQLLDGLSQHTENFASDVQVVIQRASNRAAEAYKMMDLDAAEEVAAYEAFMLQQLAASEETIKGFRDEYGALFTEAVDSEALDLMSLGNVDEFMDIIRDASPRVSRQSVAAAEKTASDAYTKLLVLSQNDAPYPDIRRARHELDVAETFSQAVKAKVDGSEITAHGVSAISINRMADNITDREMIEQVLGSVTAVDDKISTKEHGFNPKERRRAIDESSAAMFFYHPMWADDANEETWRLLSYAVDGKYPTKQRQGDSLKWWNERMTQIDQGVWVPKGENPNNVVVVNRMNRNAADQNSQVNFLQHHFRQAQYATGADINLAIEMPNVVRPHYQVDSGNKTYAVQNIGSHSDLQNIYPSLSPEQIQELVFAHNSAAAVPEPSDLGLTKSQIGRRRRSRIKASRAEAVGFVWDLNEERWTFKGSEQGHRIGEGARPTFTRKVDGKMVEQLKSAGIDDDFLERYLPVALMTDDDFADLDEVFARTLDELEDVNLPEAEGFTGEFADPRAQPLIDEVRSLQVQGVEADDIRVQELMGRIEELSESVDAPAGVKTRPQPDKDRFEEFFLDDDAAIFKDSPTEAAPGRADDLRDARDVARKNHEDRIAVNQRRLDVAIGRRDALLAEEKRGGKKGVAALRDLDKKIEQLESKVIPYEQTNEFKEFSVSIRNAGRVRTDAVEVAERGGLTPGAGIPSQAGPEVAKLDALMAEMRLHLSTEYNLDADVIDDILTKYESGLIDQTRVRGTGQRFKTSSDLFNYRGGNAPSADPARSGAVSVGSIVRQMRNEQIDTLRVKLLSTGRKVVEDQKNMLDGDLVYPPGTILDLPTEPVAVRWLSDQNAKLPLTGRPDVDDADLIGPSPGQRAGRTLDVGDEDVIRQKQVRETPLIPGATADIDPDAPLRAVREPVPERGAALEADIFEDFEGPEVPISIPEPPGQGDKPFRTIEDLKQFKVGEPGIDQLAEPERASVVAPPATIDIKQTKTTGDMAEFVSAVLSRTFDPARAMTPEEFIGEPIRRQMLNDIQEGLVQTTRAVWGSPEVQQAMIDNGVNVAKVARLMENLKNGRYMIDGASLFDDPDFVRFMAIVNDRHIFEHGPDEWAAAHPGRTKPPPKAAPPKAAQPGKSTYEVSTRGDKRFSALNATVDLGDGQGKRSIEEIYQVDIKGYDTLKEGKGKPPKTKWTKAETEEAYLDLWRRWSDEHPSEMQDLVDKAAGRPLSDQFATKGAVADQSKALQQIIDEKGLTPTSAVGESGWSIGSEEIDVAAANLQSGFNKQVARTEVSRQVQTQRLADMGAGSNTEELVSLIEAFRNLEDIPVEELVQHKAALKQAYSENKDLLSRATRQVFGEDAQLHYFDDVGNGKPGLQVSTPRSDQATYTNVYDGFDDMFAQLKDGTITAEEAITSGVPQAAKAYDAYQAMRQSMQVADASMDTAKRMAARENFEEHFTKVIVAVQDAIDRGNTNNLNKLVVRRKSSGQYTYTPQMKRIMEELAEYPAQQEWLMRYIESGWVADLDWRRTDDFNVWWQQERVNAAMLDWSTEMNVVQLQRMTDEMLQLNLQMINPEEMHTTAFATKELMSELAHLEDSLARPGKLPSVEGKTPFAAGEATEIDYRTRLEIQESRRGAKLLQQDATVFETVNAISSMIESVTGSKGYQQLSTKELVGESNRIKSANKLMDDWRKATSDPRLKESLPATGMRPAETVGLGAGITSDIDIDPLFAEFLSQTVNNAKAVFTPYAVSEAQRTMRQVINWWKAAATVVKPSFHVRNVIGGVTNGMIAGIGIGDYKAVINDVHRFRKALAEATSVGTGELTEDAFEDFVIGAVSKQNQTLFREAWKADVLQTGFARAEQLYTPTSAGRTWKPWRNDNAFFEMGGKTMESLEDVMRMATFYHWFDESAGDLATQAAKARGIVNAVHFDYSSLTDMERKIKNVMPFYVWTRRNIPLQLRTLVQNPTFLLWYNRARNDWNDQQLATIEDIDPFTRYQAQQGFIMPLRRGNDEQWAQLMWNPQLPAYDLDSLPIFEQGVLPIGMSAFSGGAWASFVVDNLGPAVSTPFDMAQASEEGGTVNAPAGMNAMLRVLDSVVPTTWITDEAFPDQTASVAPDVDYRISKSLNVGVNTALPFYHDYRAALGMKPNNPYRASSEGWLPGDDPGVFDPMRVMLGPIGRTVGRGAGFGWVTPTDIYFDGVDAEKELSRREIDLRFAAGEGNETVAPPAERPDPFENFDMEQFLSNQTG